MINVTSSADVVGIVVFQKELSLKAWVDSYMCSTEQLDSLDTELLAGNILGLPKAAARAKYDPEIFSYLLSNFALQITSDGSFKIDVAKAASCGAGGVSGVAGATGGGACLPHQSNTIGSNGSLKF